MGPGMMGWGGYGGYGWVGMILNLVITVAVIAGVVWLVILLVRRVDANRQINFGSTSAAQSPHEILQARYARGEINRDEYEQIEAEL